MPRGLGLRGRFDIIFRDNESLRADIAGVTYDTTGTPIVLHDVDGEMYNWQHIVRIKKVEESG